MQDRVGFGSDAHRFQTDPSRPLVLGGVTIPDHAGLEGHSDADVLVHAIIDALLGAAGLGDIGQHFPAGAPEYKDANSLELLRSAISTLETHGYGVGNVDVTVVAEAPRLRPHIAAMREQLAPALGVALGAVNVKATTAEQMGALGRAEGILAQAVVRIVPLKRS